VGGTWEIFWKGNGYGGSIECANKEVDKLVDEMKKTIPNFLDIPAILMNAAWFAEWDRCNNYTCIF